MGLKVYLRDYRYPGSARPVDASTRVGEVFAPLPGGAGEDSVLIWIFTCDVPGCRRDHIIRSVDPAERRLKDGTDVAETNWQDITNAIDAWLLLEPRGWRLLAEAGGTNGGAGLHSCDRHQAAPSRPAVLDVEAVAAAPPSRVLLPDAEPLPEMEIVRMGDVQPLGPPRRFRR